MANSIRILELYSGIGGMHMAFQECGLQGEIVLSVDINTTANAVYKFNFPSTPLLNGNIQSLTPQFINNLKVNAIFMSPPCQPFTRNGLKKGRSDPRSCSFSHILGILSELNIQYLLIENVKGFEGSDMDAALKTVLSDSGFYYHDFILSPTQFGIPNSRNRYYCIARRQPFTFDLDVCSLSFPIPGLAQKPSCAAIGDILECNIYEPDYLLSDSVLVKRANILDIVRKDSNRSCCFTKSYGRYVEGTGSVFCPKSATEITSIYADIKSVREGSEEYLKRIKLLQLRFFTPREVCRLMNIPDKFTFPEDATIKQKYSLLGNSINVKVVSELMKLLLN